MYKYKWSAQDIYKCLKYLLRTHFHYNHFSSRNFFFSYTVDRNMWTFLALFSRISGPIQDHSQTSEPGWEHVPVAMNLLGHIDQGLGTTLVIIIGSDGLGDLLLRDHLERPILGRTLRHTHVTRGSSRSAGGGGELGWLRTAWEAKVTCDSAKCKGSRRAKRG